MCCRRGGANRCLCIMLDQPVFLPGSALPAEIHNHGSYPFVKSGGQPYPGQAEIKREHQEIAKRQTHADHGDQPHINRELSVARGPQRVNDHQVAGASRLQEEAEQDDLGTHPDNALIVGEQSNSGTRKAITMTSIITVTSRAHFTLENTRE